MSNKREYNRKKANDFFQKKKEEVKGKMVNKKTGEKAKSGKMPSKIRERFEKKFGDRKGTGKASSRMRERFQEKRAERKSDKQKDNFKANYDKQLKSQRNG